jgi:hypothetical protein
MEIYNKELLEHMSHRTAHALAQKFRQFMPGCSTHRPVVLQ